MDLLHISPPRLLDVGFLIALGYFLGAIPFGLLLTRAAGVGDIRTIGSGNIGATNVLRTGHKGLAIATLLLDALKGAAAVFLAGRLQPDAVIVTGAAAFLGHLYPVWLKFRGGKGVATFFGVLAVLAWPVALVSALGWLTTAILFRFSSLAALAAAVLAPISAAVLGRWDVMALGVAMAALMILKHETNIARLVRGEEPRIGGKS